MKIYKDYVIKFLKLTKNNKTTRGTLRRNLGKLESRFLSHVLKDLIENKRLVKRGTTYSLVQNVDWISLDKIIFLSFPMFSRYLSLDMQLLCTSYIFHHLSLDMQILC